MLPVFVVRGGPVGGSDHDVIGSCPDHESVVLSGIGSEVTGGGGSCGGEFPRVPLCVSSGLGSGTGGKGAIAPLAIGTELIPSGGGSGPGSTIGGSVAFERVPESVVLFDKGVEPVSVCMLPVSEVVPVELSDEGGMTDPDTLGGISVVGRGSS